MIYHDIEEHVFNSMLWHIYIYIYCIYLFGYIPLIYIPFYVTVT